MFIRNSFSVGAVEGALEEHLDPRKTFVEFMLALSFGGKECAEFCGICEVQGVMRLSFSSRLYFRLACCVVEV